MQAPENVAQHFFWIALPVMLSVAAAQWISFLANRKRGREKDDALATLLNEYRLHDHGEWKDENSRGELHAENMRFPRTKGE